ncbi:unnamed protein product, partial [Prorocentrum cordatum]
MARRGVRSALERAVRPREEANRVVRRIWGLVRATLLALHRNAALVAIAILRDRFRDLEVGQRSGRTVPILVQAMGCRLFSACAVEDEPGNMAPSPGMFADCEGRPVMILKCFTRHRAHMAHTIPVEADRTDPAPHVAYLRCVFTCKQADLSDIGLPFVSAKRFCSKGKRAFRLQRSPGAMAGVPGFLEQALRQVAFARYASAAATLASLEDAGARPTPVEPIRIMPGSAHLHGRGTYMTKRFLVHLVLSFYDVLNARATRRKLCELYAASSLFSESALARTVTALPRCRVMRAILCKALGSFLAGAVQRMRRRIHIYSGQIIRGDGNHDLAQRIGCRSKEDPFAEKDFNVMLAWCGTDGCLLKPLTPAKSEAWDDVREDLGDAIARLRADRLRHGLPLREAAPVCHSTDMHGNHKDLIEDYYREMFPDLAVQVSSTTPKGDAVGASVAEHGLAPALAVGGPVHDIINVRRAASPASDDCSEFVLDWADMIARLSERPVGETDCSARGPVRGGLGQPAEALLKGAALHPAALVKRSVAAAGPAALAEARPPRGTLQRICRRLGARLHPSLQRRNCSSQKALRREARAIKRWYQPGRKLTRRRLGIRRSKRAVLRARGLRTVWNQKVELHHKRFLKPKRQEGLWRWRDIALGLHAARIPVHSGTIPVERLWASMLDMFPSSARLMSRAWFDVLAALGFLRYNYRHFHVRLLPAWAWAEADSLLAERLENLATAAHALSMWAEPDALGNLPDRHADLTAAARAMSPLFEPFDGHFAAAADEQQ